MLIKVLDSMPAGMHEVALGLNAARRARPCMQCTAASTCSPPFPPSPPPHLNEWMDAPYLQVSGYMGALEAQADRELAGSDEEEGGKRKQGARVKAQRDEGEKAEGEHPSAAYPLFDACAPLLLGCAVGRRLTSSGCVVVTEPGPPWHHAGRAVMCSGRPREVRCAAAGCTCACRRGGAAGASEGPHRRGPGVSGRVAP